MTERDTVLDKIWGSIWLDGTLVPAGEAAVSAFDRGLLYGDGLYETIRVYSGVAFLLSEHVRRLRQGAQVLRMPVPDEDIIRRAVDSVIRANGLREAYLRLTLTRGVDPDDWTKLEPCQPRLIVMARPLPSRDYGDGFALAVSPFRIDPASPLRGVKHTGIMPKIMARRLAAEEGCQDALLLTADGFVGEASAASVFWVHGGSLFTPSLDCGILDGLTRMLVLQVASLGGIPAEEGRFSLEHLLHADEVFLTSSTWELVPVKRVGLRDFAAPRPGPLTRRLMELYGEEVRRLIEEDAS
ncbi:MAG: branched chain amino acid aminotransferase [Armatimonadota bacterium]|nr:MAG: branched chain amino acid aminotransferase [Armatimonadota bacterium]